jgi:replicative DNA helicase
VSLRSLPHALDAERALLGGMITEPADIPDLMLVAASDDFFRPEHAALAALLYEMSARGDHIDTISVPERIGREGREERYGGVAYVMELRDHVPSTANLAHYAEVVREKALLRRLVGVGQGLVDRAAAQPEDTEQVLNDVLRELQQVGSATSRRSWHEISTEVDQELLAIEERGNLKKAVAGHSTGYKDLDAQLAGLHDSNLVVLAARPAMGKTALALNIALNVARSEDERRAVGIFSMEMSRSEIVSRMLCCQGLVNASHVRTGRLDSDEWARLVDASEHLSSLPVRIDDSSSLTLGEIRNRARRLQADMGPLGLLVVDYLQLMRGEDRRAPREQQVAQISGGLKALAKDLACPVLALSQLNRGVEGRAEKRPLASDLRESGSIEQDADVILFIYRDEVYNPETEDKGLAEIIIAKQRNGPTGVVKLVFQGQFARFDTWAGARMVRD